MAFLGKAVRDYRFKLMRELMDREGYDALALTSDHFFQFATNFHVDVQGWERPMLVVLPRNGEPFAIFSYTSVNHWRYSSEAGLLWVDDIQFYAEHVQLRGRLPLQSNLGELVADKLREAGLHRSRIGVDAITAKLIDASKLLPQLRLEETPDECSKLLLVKHAEEIAIMRDAASLADWIQDRYKENIRPGRLIQELDLTMMALGAEEAARRFPGENIELFPWGTLSGPSSAACHSWSFPTGARIQKGDGIVNMVCPRMNGLWIEDERTFFCGKPTARQAELYEATLAATQAGCAAALAGNSTSAIDEASQNVYERAGLGDLIITRTGHGMGLMGHEWPLNMPFNTRKLLAGQVFSVEESIYEWGLGGFRVDDTVVVGEKPEILTKAAKELSHQIIDY